MMEYFLFNRWQEAVSVLSEYDAYGCMLNDFVPQPYKYHYAGNFWWTKAEYLRRVPKFTEEDKKDRLKAETWLNSVSDNSYSAFNTSAYTYSTPVPRFLYNKDLPFNLIEFIRFVETHFGTNLRRIPNVIKYLRWKYI